MREITDVSSRPINITRIDDNRRPVADALVTYCLSRIADDGRWQPSSGLFGESIGY